MSSIVDVLSRSTDTEATEAGIIRNIPERSPIANFWFLQFRRRIESKIFQRGTYPAAQFRRFQKSFDKKTTKPVEPIRTQQHDFGLRVELDPMFLEEENRFGTNYRADVVAEMGESLALDLKKSFLGKYPSSEDNRTFGVYQWIDEYDGSNNDIKFHIQSSGTDANLSTAGAGVFVARMQQLIDLVQPDYFVTNRDILSQISQLANSTSNDYLGGRWTRRQVDILGRPVRVYAYEDIPIFDIGEDSQDAQIMAFDETDGSGSVSSSIVGVRNGSRETTMLHYNQGLVGMREYVDSGLTNIEVTIPHAIEVRQKSAAGRIFGILAA